MTKLEILKDLLRGIIIQVLAYENNGFEKIHYQVVSQLLNAINEYPKIGYPSVELGIEPAELTNDQRSSGDYHQLVISFNDELLRLVKNGICNFNGASESIMILINQEPDEDDIDWKLIGEWIHECEYVMANEDYIISIECYEPECML